MSLPSSIVGLKVVYLLAYRSFLLIKEGVYAGVKGRLQRKVVLKD